MSYKVKMVNFAHVRNTYFLIKVTYLRNVAGLQPENMSYSYNNVFLTNYFKEIFYINDTLYSHNTNVY